MADSIGYIRMLPATPEYGCGISLSFSRSDKFGMEKLCYDISWHRCCCIVNGRRKEIFGSMNNRDSLIKIFGYPNYI